MLIIMIPLSIYKSRELYRFYLETYYIKYKKEDMNSMVKRAHILLKKERYKELKEYLVQLDVLYPQNSEIMGLTGINYMNLGEKKKGAELFISSIDGSEVSRKYIQEAIKILFEEKLYGDIVSVLLKFDPGENPEMNHIFGISLYQTGRYKEAIPVLKKALTPVVTPEDCYYLGLSYDKMKDFQNAVLYFEKGYKLNPRDELLKKALIDAYRKAGNLQNAEKMLRKK